MIDLTAIALNLPVFVLALCRASGIFLAAPMLSHNAIPVRIKVVLSVLLALIMYPFAARFSGPLPGGFLAYLPLVLKEFGLGLIMGFAASLIIAALQSAGSMVAQQIGITLSEIASPASRTRKPDFGVLRHSRPAPAARRGRSSLVRGGPGREF